MDGPAQVPLVEELIRQFKSDDKPTPLTRSWQKFYEKNTTTLPLRYRVGASFFADLDLLRIDLADNKLQAIETWTRFLKFRLMHG